MSNNHKAEFMQVFTEKCSKFFHDMHLLCDAYNKQFGGSGATSTILGSSHSSSKNNKLSQSDIHPSSKHTTSDKKKNSAPKDPNMPKKPASAYIIYFSERQSKVKEKYQELNVTEISKLIAKDWRELTDSQKRPYLELAQEKQADYVKRVTEYAKKNPNLDIKIPGQSSKKKAKESKEGKSSKKKILSSDEGSENEEASAQSDNESSSQPVQAPSKSQKRKLKEVSSSEEDSESDSYEQQPQKKKHH